MATIHTIHGIGWVMASKFRRAGVASTDALLKAGATVEGRITLAARVGVEEATILRWVNQADLMRVKGIGRQYADLLEAAGVASVRDLARFGADELRAALQIVNESEALVRQLPTLEAITCWVEAANALDSVVES